MTWRDPRSVLVPVDFSKAAFHAVEEAIAFVGTPSKVHVVHVLQPLPVTTPGVVWGEVDEASRRAHVLDALGKELGDKGATLHVQFGDPGRSVATLADELDVDLIILPSHGRSGLPRLLLGSVAERVLRLAHKPVLVLRHKDLNG
ncbi:MAG: universal stress protein [Myxococcales bacterium]|nr:universal stress protein [Myxococcales bacterium]